MEPLNNLNNLDNTFHNKNLKNLSFLVTGGAGFIGSHIAQYLLENGAGKVRVIDNFSNGFQSNLDILRPYNNFEFIEADIRNFESCKKACEGIDFVSHQAALGSVPRSIKDPSSTNDVNVGGSLNMLVAALDAKVKRFIYAASSSTYGDSESLP